MNFYYYLNQNKYGPVNVAQLRALAANGTICAETIVEVIETGKRYRAGTVKGLEFPGASPMPPLPTQANPFAANYPAPGAVPASAPGPEVPVPPVPRSGAFRVEDYAGDYPELIWNIKNMRQLATAIYVVCGVIWLIATIAACAMFGPQGLGASVLYFLLLFFVAYCLARFFKYRAECLVLAIRTEVNSRHNWPK